MEERSQPCYDVTNCGTTHAVKTSLHYLFDLAPHNTPPVQLPFHCAYSMLCPHLPLDDSAKTDRYRAICLSEKSPKI